MYSSTYGYFEFSKYFKEMFIYKIYRTKHISQISIQLVIFAILLFNFAYNFRSTGSLSSFSLTIILTLPNNNCHTCYYLLIANQSPVEREINCNIQETTFRKFLSKFYIDFGGLKWTEKRFECKFILFLWLSLPDLR